MNKKIRKLLRSPRQFFVDAGFNVLRRINNKPQAATPGKLACRFRYSFILVVSGDHTVAADRVLAEVVSQSVNSTEAIEVVCVDTRPEGSADWAPLNGKMVNCRVVRRPGASKSTARNEALTRVSGDWTSFIDVDETISAEYVQKVDQFLKGKQGAGVGLVCCKLGYRDPANGKISAAHPRNEEFAAKNKVAPVGKLRKFYVNSLAGLFFRTSVLWTHAARFAGKGATSAQEAIFASKYLYQMAGLQVALLVNCRILLDSTRQRHEAAELFNLKRSGVIATRDQFVQLFKLGCDSPEQPPARHAVLAALYYLAACVDQAVNDGLSSPDESGDVEGAIDQIFEELFQYIPVELVEDFRETGFRNRVGLLKRYKGSDPKTQAIYVENYDDQNLWVKLRYFSGDIEPFEIFQWGTVDVTPGVTKSRLIEFAGRPFVYERVVWLPCDEGRGRLNARINKAVGKTYLGGKLDAEVLPWKVAEHYGPPRPLVEASLPVQARALRRLASRPENVEKYRDAWLFIDRDVEADDNAEHLYRYVKNNHPEINAFFILHEKSASWARLSQEGFRLLPFDSMAHKVALLHCRQLLSSHAAPFVVNVLPKQWYGDLLKFKFTFLQHGVTKDDISKWINSRSIECFVTTSNAEYFSIAGNGTRYKVTSREVVKTGFPRHDALLAGAGTPEKLIMIMPTWRLFLAGKLQGSSSTRTINNAFFDSQYAKAWKGILHSERFARVMNEHGYKAVLFPHPNIEPYLDWFEVPDFIHVIRSEQRGSIQSLFQRSAMMLTDYSSVAFEMAYLHKPVLYYQFDRDLVFGGHHSYQKGYYDYDLHGFGPVAFDEDKYLDEIEKFVARNCEPGEQYRKRMDAAFAHIDTDNCRRTFEAVLSTDTPRNQRGVVPGLSLRYAELASQHGEWPVAVERWKRQVLTCDKSLRPRAVLMQLQALRQTDKLQEAQELLETLDAQAQAMLPREFVAERAELSMASRQWAQALQQWEQLVAAKGISDAEREHFQNRLEQARAEMLLSRACELRQLGQLEQAASLLCSHQAPAALRFLMDVELAEIATERQQWTSASAAWQQLMDSPFATDTQKAYFEERFNTIQPLASRMQLAGAATLPSGAESGTPAAVGMEHPMAAKSDGHMLPEQLDQWAKLLLLLPDMDQEVRLASLREIAHQRIRAGDLDNAEIDINALRTQGPQTPSQLLLSLELAVARGHAGEATATLNMLLGMPLSGLSTAERKRFAAHLNALATV